MIFFKMVEALRIREIDQMIESFQKDVERPEIITTQTPAKIKIQTATPEMAIEKAPLAKIPKREEIVAEPTLPKHTLYDELVAKIHDRNAQLGECFTQSITYVSYEGNTLTWESCADEECKKTLKHGYSVIKQLVREIFSFETKIKGIPCSKVKLEEPAKIEEITANVVANIVQPQMNEPQSMTMIEDAEYITNASCASNCSDENPIEEINGTDITKEPMVAKAIEMFEAKKVTVQSKV
jgi:DNA polymerase-3 subunit gamma/tau